MRAPACALVALLSLTACPKKEEPKPVAVAPVAPAAAPKSKTAEVEFFGTFSAGKTQVAKSFFVVMEEPCSPVPAEAHPYGKVELTAEKLFAEFYPPQGSRGHLCAYGLDAAGKVVAYAAFGKNPVTFQGEGEVIVDHVDLNLEPLAEAAPLPKGL